MSPAGAARPNAPGELRPAPDAEEFDRLRRRVLWAMPSGLYLVGTRAGDRLNLMTASWALQVATDPKVIAVSIEKDAVTRELVESGRVFCLSLIDRADRQLVRKFVKPASHDPASRTLNGFSYGQAMTGAPYVREALAYLDCEVREEVGLGSHTLFLGEVVDAAFLRDEATPVLRMEDTRMSYGG